MGLIGLMASIFWAVLIFNALDVKEWKDVSSMSKRSVAKLDVPPPLPNEWTNISSGFGGGIYARVLLQQQEMAKRCETLKDRLDATSWIIRFQKSLPDICTRLHLCNEEKCIIMKQSSFLYSIFADFDNKDGNDTLGLVRSFHAVEYRNKANASLCQWVPILSRRRRGVIRDPLVNPKLGLRFTLPGTRYCGPGTDVSEMDKVGPLNKLDAACRAHDLDYMKACTDAMIWKADDDLLDRVRDVDPVIFSIFFAFFKAKRLYEYEFGSPYASAMEVCQDNNTLRYEEIKSEEKEKNIMEFKKYENEWKNGVKELWQNHCHRSLVYENTNPASCSPVDAGDDEVQKQRSINSDTPEDTVSNLAGESLENVNMEGGESQSEHCLKVKLPQTPIKFRPCAIVLNSVKVGFVTKDQKKFLEIGKICKPNVVNSEYGMDGLAVAGINPKAGSIFAFNLFTGKVFRQVPSRRVNTEEQLDGVFVLSNAPDYGHDEITTNMLQDMTDDVSFVALLYFNQKDIQRNLHKKLLLKKDKDGKELPIILTDALKKILSERIKDGIMYGRKCDESCLMFLKSLWPPFTVLDNLLPLRSSQTFPSDEGGDLSMNRCSPSLQPFEHDSFILSKPSPGEKNVCPTDMQRVMPSTSTVPKLFTFRSKGMQRSGQRMIYNLNNFFTEYGIPQSLPKASTVQAVALGLNVGERTVYKYLKKLNEGEPAITPGKKRKNPCRIRGKFDSYEADVIRRIIVDYYKRGVAPLFDNIYSEYMSSDEGFKCSKDTFRKVLRGMNFRYKKINLRSVLVQREDVVIKRGLHLRRLRENEAAGQNAAELVFTDETWIDTSARIGKAWMPKQFGTFREAAKFAFPRAKSQASPRLVVLAAGDSSGIISQSILVYPVLKTTASLDYHDNVNAETYLTWFEDLLKTLALRKKKYVIVMDNAPYHSSSSAPLLSSKKRVLYDWLNAPDQKAKLQGRLKTFEEMRTLDLKTLVRELKTANNYYQIENLASRYGQEILRLPPWNCDINPIEYCWKDTKHTVKKENTRLSTDELKELTIKTLKEYPPDKWKKHLEHVRKLRDKYWQEDGWTDEVPKSIQPIIINTNEDSGSDEDDNDIAQEEYGDFLGDDEDWQPQMPSLSSALDGTPNTDEEYASHISDYYGPAEDTSESEAMQAMKLTYDLFHDQATNLQSDCTPVPKPKRKSAVCLFPDDVCMSEDSDEDEIIE